MYHLQPFHLRINRIIIAFILVVCLIIIRLIQLQIAHAHHYQAEGEKNFLRTEITRSPRGNILDCKGNLLVTNRPVMNMCWIGTGNRILSESQHEILTTIESIIGKPIITDAKWYLKICNAEKRCQQLPIAQDISHEQLSQLKELFPENRNLSVVTDFQRYYPCGSYASHILGYLERTTPITPSGKTGLEKMCNHELQGRDGIIAKTINSFGQHISTQEIELPRVGNDIRTTLDLDIQQIAENAFPSPYNGTFLVMDPEKGDLKAIVSRPSFDPALFLRPIPSATWNHLQINNTFLNRAFNPYPPGSIFKLVTISAALESNLINPEQCWQCEGHVNFVGRNYWCHHRWGHGELTTIQAVAQSCNVIFYEIGKRIDIDTLAHYAALFGLGKPTGILFPERNGLIPSREWKLKNKGERWWPGETLSVTIGQSFLLATPLQIARMVSSIFTGYLVKPRILEQEPVEWKPLMLRKETINFLKRSMELVVQKGTGKQVDIAGMNIYAKTSTAQTADFSKRTLDSAFLEHAWFVAHMQYKSDKPLVFVILVEHAGSSKVAALIARKFLLAYKQKIDYCPDEVKVSRRENPATKMP